MFFYDVVAYGKTKTGPLADLLGGKERLEYPGQVFRSNSLSRVSEYDHDMIILAECFDGNYAVTFNSMGGIDQNIHKHLFYLVRKAVQHRQIRVIFPLDIRDIFYLVTQHIESRIQALIDADRLAFGLIHMRKTHEILYYAPHPLGAVLRLFQQTADIVHDKIDLHLFAQFIQSGNGLRIIFVLNSFDQGALKGNDLFHVFTHRGEIAGDKTHRVVDLVGYSGGQLPDGGHLLLLERLRLGPL